MFDKGRVSALEGGKAVVIPSWTDEAVTCPLTIPPRFTNLIKVNANVVYAMFDDVTGIIIEVMDDYEDVGLNGIAAHVGDKNNPHKVTKGQIGLGNVDNTSDAEKNITTRQLFSIYPVNIVVEFGANINPNIDIPEWEGIGWSWERYAEGNTTVGYKPGDSLFGTVGATGGSRDTIVISHTHPQTAHTHTVGANSVGHTHAQVAHTHTVSTTSLTGSVWNIAYQSASVPISATGVFSRRTTSEGTGVATTSKTQADGFNLNASHAHSVTGGATTSGGQSANHIHSVTGGAGTTGSASGGVAGTNKNLQPYQVTAKWIRTT